MKIAIWAIGKTDEKYLEEGIGKYLKRLVHYAKVDYQELKDVKAGQTPDETLRREAESIFSKLKAEDILILLDERGNMYDSVQFSAFIDKLQVQSTRSVVFLIGGAYGHHKLVRDRAQHLISLSKMTLSHQMVRLFLVEQLYRAFTIIKNEKYHNI